MKTSQLLFYVVFLTALTFINASNSENTIVSATKTIPGQPTDPSEKEKFCEGRTPVTPLPGYKEECIRVGGVWTLRHEYCYDTYYCDYSGITKTTTTALPTLRTIPIFTKSKLSTTSSITLATSTAEIIATRPLPLFSNSNISITTTTLTKTIPTTTTTTTSTKTIPTTTTTTTSTKTIPTTTTTTILTKTIPTTTTTTTTSTKTIPTTTTTSTKTIPTTTTTSTKTIPTTTTTSTKTIPTTTTTKTIINQCSTVKVTITEIDTVTITETVKVTSTSTTTTTNQNCATKWGQCGGIGFNGPTCCQSGSKCVFVNDYYSQCL